MMVRQTLTAPIAGGRRLCAMPTLGYSVFEHSQRYHGGGFAGSGFLPDEL